MVVRPVLLSPVGAGDWLLKRVGCDYGAEIRTLQQKGADIYVIGDRLKAERERLGLTQPAFAELAGSKKRTLIDWEKGLSSPTAVQLAALAESGVDVLYVLTGQRSQPVPAKAELRPDQAALLDNYEHSDEVARQAAQRLLDPRSQRKKA